MFKRMKVFGALGILVFVVSIFIIGAIGLKVKNETDVQLCEIEYSGIDWVQMDELSFEQGDQFISGKGINYTIVSEEVNDVSGRIRVVILTDEGEKRMIANLPAFCTDVKTGICYYDIYEYATNENYIEF